PLAVLDWDMSDIGDHHADVATTVVLLRCAPNVGNTLRERTLVASGRRVLQRAYLRCCRRRMVIDDSRVAYIPRLAARRRLAYCAGCVIAGPQSNGAKPSFVRHMPEDHLPALCRHFRRVTGINIELLENACGIRPQMLSGKGPDPLVFRHNE